MHDSPFTLSTGEKLKLLEEREQEKEKSAVHGSKADKVMAEVEELKSKMRSIELEKTSLQTTVSSFCNIIIIFHSCFKESFYWIMHWTQVKTQVRNPGKFVLVFFPVQAKIQCAHQNTSLHRVYVYVYSVNVCCPLMYRCSH